MLLKVPYLHAGLFTSLGIWFIVSMEAAASVFYALPCDAHSWVQSSCFSSVDSQSQHWVFGQEMEEENRGHGSLQLWFRI